MMPFAYARIITVAALLALTGYGLWHLYRGGYEAGADAVQVRWDQERIAAANAQQKALGEYVRRLQEAELQHDKDRAVIDDLHDKLGRVRIHLPTPASPAVNGENLSCGIFSARVDESFARLQERASTLFRQCDLLNQNLVRANTRAE